ncbi:MAG: M56 family metallopeptidase [Phycisphaerae bacterium]
MNNILNLFANGIVNYLLFCSVVAALLTLLAWGIIRVAKVRAPIYRHMIWLYLLMGIVVLPAIWLGGPKLTLAVLPTKVEPLKAEVLETDAGNAVKLVQNSPDETHLPSLTHTRMPVETNPGARAFPIRAVLAGVWLVGVVFVLARFAVGWYRLRRIRLSTEPVLQNERIANLDGQKLRILVTSHVQGPVCFGVLRPVILLPKEMYEKSTEEDLQMVLNHELAHIERRDCLTNLFQRIVEAAFFFHPLVLYASSQLTQQREQICDNYVLKKGVHVMDYIKLLSRIAEQGLEKTWFHAVALFESRLAQRVRSLLDPKHNTQTKVSRRAAILCAIAVMVCLMSGAIRLEAQPSKDDPAAHALYDKMIETMGKAESLSYKSDYKFEAGGKLLKSCTYAAWLKKPNYVRIETDRAAGPKAGTLIGDGECLWIYWLGERPPFSFEDRFGVSSEKSRFNVYMKEAAPTGKDSIRYKTPLLGAGMGVPVIDPSTFHGHGHAISKKPQIEGIKSTGTEKVRDEECDVIEVSFNKGQEIWRLWLSKADYLPRKLKRVMITKKNDIAIMDELWSDVTVDAEIPAEKFAWTPPEGWNLYRLPDPEEGILKPGQVAPDFELLSAEGTKIRLSDYRGKIVWFYSWGSWLPPSEMEMRHLQEYYLKNKGKNLVVLGFNCSDNKETALDFIQKHSVTFPNVIDSSDAAQNYTMSRVMLSYIIDKEGKVVDCWDEYDKDHKRAIAALQKLGLKLR